MSANFSNAMLTGIAYLPGSTGIVSRIFPWPGCTWKARERRSRAFFGESAVHDRYRNRSYDTVLPFVDTRHARGPVPFQTRDGRLKRDGE